MQDTDDTVGRGATPTREPHGTITTGTTTGVTADVPSPNPHRAASMVSTPSAADDLATGGQWPDQAQEHLLHLQRALESRTDISVAIGILVERNGWTRQQAFDWLVTLSQNTNTKVIPLARNLIRDTESRSQAGALR